MINIIKEDLTVSRFILIFIIICFITALLTIIYSSKLKDDLNERACTAFGSRYEDGKCLETVGVFD
jgi:cell division protein FtsL